jgi:hypothetical protein
VKKKEEALPPAPHMCPMAGLAPPPDAGTPVVEEAETESATEVTETDENLPKEVKYIGTVNVTRGNLGAGMVFHIYGKHTFLNLFTQFTYGFALKHVSAKEVLLNTGVNTQKTINVGISFGIR